MSDLHGSEDPSATSETGKAATAVMISTPGSSIDANPDPSLVRAPPRRFKRKLTTFLAQEMLYEFATGQLDPERHQAVDDFVSADRECQTLLEGIRGSLEFVERLSRTQLNPESLELLRESENVISLSRRYSKWSSWPDSMRWSIVALAVSATVAASVALVPWQKISFGTGGRSQDTVEVAKIPVESADQLKTMQDASEAEPAQAEGSGDEMDVADSGSGDDEAGEHGAVSLTPAQKAKIAQEAKAEQAAQKAEDAAAEKAAKNENAQAAQELERARKDEATTRLVQTAAQAGAERFRRAGEGSTVSQAPLLLRRDSMPLIARLTDNLLAVPQGFIPPQTARLNESIDPGAKVAGLAAGPSTHLDQGHDSSPKAASNEDTTPGAAAEEASAATSAASSESNSTKLNKTASAAPASRPESGDGEKVDSSGDSFPGASATAAGVGGTSATAASGLKKEGKPQGFVYRAFMTLDDLDTLGPKITQLVQELGGVKAGEVELGWKKGNSVRYYHFSIPEDNQDKLIEQLQTYGPVRISKDPHPRIMPKGEVRFILWVEAPKSH